MTSDAPTSCPTLITVAWLSDAATGRCSCSKARTRSSRVIADRPRAFNSSASSIADASPSHVSLASRWVFSNGTTRMREDAAGLSRRALGTTVREANGQDNESGGSREDPQHRAGHAAADSPAVACRMMTDIEQT